MANQPIFKVERGDDSVYRILHTPTNLFLFTHLKCREAQRTAALLNRYPRPWQFTDPKAANGGLAALAHHAHAIATKANDPQVFDTCAHCHPELVETA